jgi:hypothetical protein
MINHQPLVGSLPTICTLPAIWTVPSRSLSADGALRTFNWEMVCPSTGATTTVGVGGSGVGEGRGVWVGGRVAVTKSGAVGVGVSGRAVTSGLQAALRRSTDTNMAGNEIRFTSHIVPKKM